ncbi:MAG: ECF transporter S component, partial [Bacilli bacterium]
MKNNRRIRQITGIALLSALAIALQFLSNFIASIGIASITLALIPIVVAACVYGPYAGLLVGVLVGASVLPGAVFFLNFSPVVTVFVCLLKTGLAG